MKRSLRIKVGSGDFMSIEVDDLLHPIFLTLSDDEFAAIAAANGYIKLADDEIVIKRATGEHAARLSERYHCDDPNCPCGECEADLASALSREVKK